MSDCQKHARWLHEELPRLVEKGVLDPTAASSLQAHYGSALAADSRKTPLVILASIGSLLVGLGIILLFAYNWDTLPRSGKTFLAFLPLTVSAGLAAYGLRRRSDSRAWLEATSLAVGLSVAACVGLVSQAYQISGDLKSFYTLWLWTSLPLLYAFRTHSAFLLVTLVTVLWAALDFGRLSLVDWPTFLAVNGFCLHFLIQARREKAASLLTSCYIVSALIGFSALLGARLPLLWPTWTAALLAVVYLWEENFRGEAIGRKRFIPGCLAELSLVSVCLILTFEGSWSSGQRDFTLNTPDEYLAVAIVALLFAVYGLQANRCWQRNRWTGIGWVFAPLAIAAGNALSLAWTTNGAAIAAMVLNLYLFASAVAMGLGGFLSQSVSRMNRGMLAIVALAAVRFFDSEFSILARGIGFVTLGVVFLLANLFLAKQRKESSHE